MPNKLTLLVANQLPASFLDLTYLRKDDNYQKDGGSANYDTTGAFTLINGTPTGTDWETRTGRQLVMTSVTIRGTIRGNSASNRSTNRTIVLYDKQTKGATPTLASVLDGTSPTANFNRYLGLHRFEILYDNLCTTVGQGGGAGTNFTDNSVIPWQFSMPLNHPVIFSGTGATVSSIDYGGLFILTFGNQAAGTGAATLDFDYIVTFVDK